MQAKPIRKTKLAIDLDGTLVDTIGMLLECLNNSGVKTDGLPLEKEDLTDYQFLNLRENQREFLDYCLKDPLLMAGAKPFTIIRDLPRQWEIVIVTSRPVYMKDITVAQVKHIFDDSDRTIDIIMAKEKAPVINTIKPNIVIEDSPRQIEAVLEKSKVPVIVIDAPYNRYLVNERLRRVDNIDAAIELCRKLFT